MGETATTGAAVARTASLMPGHLEDRAHRDDRVRRPEDHGARAGDRVEDGLRGVRRLDPLELDAVDRALAALADHELLEGHPTPAGQDAGTHGLIGHRQDARAQPEAARELGDRLGQRGALRQALRAAQADREVAVAEVEPDLDAELAQLRHRVEGVAVKAPAALVDAIGQPEGAQVRIGADVGAVDLDVVGGVGHHDELVADHVEHPAGELGAARPTGEDDDHGLTLR